MTTNDVPPAPHQPTSIHDILVAWQAGRLASRQAMALCGIESFDELYLAARNSGVPLRKTLLSREKRAADLATAAIRKRLSRARA